MLHDEVIDEQQTPLGTLTLLRRRLPRDAQTVFYEIRLRRQVLMSSLINISEQALAQHALDALPERPCDVLVGGLGLGYTAQAALKVPKVQSVTVVEFLPAVVQWHRAGLLPLGKPFLDNPAVEVIEADFFALIGATGHRLNDTTPALGLYDAILLDIDDAPDKPLHQAHQSFYSVEGLRHLKKHLKPDGVFALWSYDPNTDLFTDVLKQVFSDVRVHPVPHFDVVYNAHRTHVIYVALG